MKPINNQFFQEQLQRREIEAAMYQQEMNKQLNPPRQQGAGGGGMNPMGIAKQFMGGEGLTSAGMGTGGAAQLPGLQASGATTAGIGMGGTGTGAAAGPVVGTPLSAGGGGAAMAGPLAAGGALFAGNEYLQGKMGHRDDFEDYATWFVHPYTDTYNYMEEGFGKLKGLFSDIF